MCGVDLFCMFADIWWKVFAAAVEVSSSGRGIFFRLRTCL